MNRPKCPTCGRVKPGRPRVDAGDGTHADYQRGRYHAMRGREPEADGSPRYQRAYAAMVVKLGAS